VKNFKHGFFAADVAERDGRVVTGLIETPSHGALVFRALGRNDSLERRRAVVLTGPAYHDAVVSTKSFATSLQKGHVVRFHERFLRITTDRLGSRSVNVRPVHFFRHNVARSVFFNEQLDDVEKNIFHSAQSDAADRQEMFSTVNESGSVFYRNHLGYKCLHSVNFF